LLAPVAPKVRVGVMVPARAAAGEAANGAANEVANRATGAANEVANRATGDATGAVMESDAANGDGTVRTCSGETAKENCHHFTVLVGYSIAQATERARGAGFTGKIEVGNLADHDAACKDGAVCSVTPLRWEFGQGETLTLWVNRKVAISVPE
jgi:hypothetical protein